MVAGGAEPTHPINLLQQVSDSFFFLLSLSLPSNRDLDGSTVSEIFDHKVLHDVLSSFFHHGEGLLKKD